MSISKGSTDSLKAAAETSLKPGFRSQQPVFSNQKPATIKPHPKPEGSSLNQP
jgi:hypothetical protein